MDWSSIPPRQGAGAAVRVAQVLPAELLRKHGLVPGAAGEMARIRALLALGREALGAYARTRASRST